MMACQKKKSVLTKKKKIVFQSRKQEKKKAHFVSLFLHVTDNPSESLFSPFSFSFSRLIFSVYTS